MITTCAGTNRNMAASRTCGLHQTSSGNLTFSCITGNTSSGLLSTMTVVHSRAGKIHLSFTV